MANPVVANIVMGNAIVYYAPVGESEPADSVAYGTAWGGNWARVGYTNAPLVMAYEDEQVEAVPQEALTAVKRAKSAESARFETSLAELEADYLKLAFGAGTVSNTAAGAGQVAKEELVIGGDVDLDEYAWGFEGRYKDSSGNDFPVRVWIHKATAKLNGELEFSRESEGVGIPLQINALADTGKAAGQQLFKLQRVTAAATS